MMISVTKRNNGVSSRALTFIELLIVVAIIGIIIGVSIPQFRKTFENFKFDNFVKDIFYLSRYIQASAISQSKIYCLNISTQENKFWATYKTEEGFRNAEGKFGRAYIAPEGINIYIDKPGQTDAVNIYFYPDGSSDEATINFENNYKNKLSLIYQGAAGDIKIQ